MEPWVRVFALSAGGALGVNARYWLGYWMSRWASPQFPWATFTINVSGSFAIGLLTMVLARWSPHSHLRLLVLVGFLGGYTTFSTFTFESLTLWERGEPGLALANLCGSVAAGFAAVTLGATLARGLVLPHWERAARDDRATRAAVSSLPPWPPPIQEAPIDPDGHRAQADVGDGNAEGEGDAEGEGEGEELGRSR